MSYEKEFDLMKEQAGITSNNLVFSDEIAKKAGIVKGNDYNVDYVANNFTYASGNTQQAYQETQEKVKEEKTNEKVSYEEIQQEKEKKVEQKVQQEIEQGFEQAFTDDFEKEYQAFLQQKESFEKEVQREKSEQEYEKRKMEEMRVEKSGYEEKTTLDLQIEKKEEKIELSNERMQELNLNHDISKENIEEFDFSSKEKELTLERETEAKEQQEYEETMAEDFIPKQYGDVKDRKNYYVQSFAHAGRSPQDINEIDRLGIKEAKTHEENFDHVVNYAKGYTSDKREIIRQEEMEAGVYYQNQRENEGGFQYR